MNFKQKRGIYKTTLDFGTDALDSTFSFYNNRRGGTVPYDQIPLGWKYTERKGWRAKYFSAGFALFGIVGGCAIMAEQSPRAPEAHQGGMIFMAICFAAALVVYVTDRLVRPPAGFTLIPATHEIRVIHDKQYQTIIDEILKRRHDALRRKHAAIDPLNATGAESRKFRWLREEGVVTEQEYNDAITRLAARTGDAPNLSHPEQKKLH